MSETNNTAAPRNPTTGRAYKGGNVTALLEAQFGLGYATAEWAGYSQWQKAGRQVRKGETCTAIKYMVPVKDRKTGKAKMKDGQPVLRAKTLRVFNIAQTITAEEAAEVAAAA